MRPVVTAGSGAILDIERGQGLAIEKTDLQRYLPVGFRMGSEFLRRLVVAVETLGVNTPAQLWTRQGAADFTAARLVLMVAQLPTRSDDIVGDNMIDGQIRNRPARLETLSWQRSITMVPRHGYRCCWQLQRPVEVTS